MLCNLLIFRGDITPISGERGPFVTQTMKLAIFLLQSPLFNVLNIYVCSATLFFQLLNHNRLLGSRVLCNAKSYQVMPKSNNNIGQGMGLWAADWQWLEKSVNLLRDERDDKKELRRPSECLGTVVCVSIS